MVWLLGQRVNVGAIPSWTTTILEQVLMLLLWSFAVMITDVFAVITVPVAGDCVMVTLLQSSVALASATRFGTSALQLTSSSAVIVPAGQMMTGAVLSAAVMVNSLLYTPPHPIEEPFTFSLVVELIGASVTLATFVVNVLDVAQLSVLFSHVVVAAVDPERVIVALPPGHTVVADEVREPAIGAGVTVMLLLVLLVQGAPDVATV